MTHDERVCPHGVGHPERGKPHHGGGIHGCDGCCVPMTPQPPERPESITFDGRTWVPEQRLERLRAVEKAAREVSDRMPELRALRAALIREKGAEE